MLNQLNIRNFRMLSDFSVGPLGRVNLIVGRNNSGKSTVLEALRLLAEGGHARFLFALLGEHDELATNSSDTDVDRAEPTVTALRHLFTGRKIPAADGVPIEIGTDAGIRLTLEHLFFEVHEEETKDPEGKITGVRRTRVPLARATLSNGESDLLVGLGAVMEGFKVTLQDELSSRSFWLDSIEPWYGRRGSPMDPTIRRLPYGYIPTHFVSLDELAAWWDQIVFTHLEARVVEALGIIEPNVVGLTFIKNPASSRVSRARERAYERIPVVKLRGQSEPVALNSMGDGMVRVLQLLLAMVPAKGGFLLVDEFENGLYFEVQEAVWRLVFQLASELNIQVFATTHSRDCIESFARASRDNPERGVLFKMAQSRLTDDRHKVIATVYDEERLALATETELEVR